MPSRGTRLVFFTALGAGFLAACPANADPPRLRVLFLGDDGHHRPRERFQQLETALAPRGIEVAYTDRNADLNPETLGKYDGLIIYANSTRIAPEEEKALLDYVAGGKGFIPIHCASYCFHNSQAYIELVGAQFQRHGTGVFRAGVVAPEHPLLKGYGGFESWDETYVHHRHHEQDRTVLEVRAEGADSEPWTWVRAHGKGRVFYTAWGHDERTWGHPGFQNLVERGIRWATGGDPAAAPPYRDAPEMTARRSDVKPFAYVEANVPFYPAGRDWGVIGEPFKTMQAPLDPEESRKHMVTPAGFEARLFASDPDIVKPICMNWDERGRLWIAETTDYPYDFQPEGEGRDRIKICEDTDGDGKADRFKVFADKLSLPTSIAFARGGVILHQPPLTLFLRDVNGDDVADERQALFRGWSLADTHAGPSNLHYGFDNWLWGICGYSGFAETVGGERVSFRQGFYRFLPDGSRIEFLRNTNNNSWGVGFSEEGICFGSTANANPSVHLPIPNRHYEAVRGWSTSVLAGIAGNPPMRTITDKVRQVDQHGRFTSAAGHALYTARTYPREYWNRIAFVCEPTGHLVAAFQVDPAGGSFRSRYPFNLLESDDEWTAPIMAEVGPDGHVWVIDWYNYIVQHNPTPKGFETGKGAAYITDLRDKKHGRILRVVYKDAAPAPRTSLAGASSAALVPVLSNDNLLWRRHAQRLLVERGDRTIIPLLIALAQTAVVDAGGQAPGVIHALWTLHGLGALDGSDPAASAAAVAALRHPAAGVRRNAALVLPRTESSTRAILEAGRLGDLDPQARLAALLALSEMPAAEDAATALAAATADPMIAGDRWLRDALTCAAAAHDLSFLKALARRPPAAAPDRDLAAVIERVAEHHARAGAAEALPGLLAAVAGEPGGDVAGAVVAGLRRGWPKDRAVKLDAAAEAALARLFGALPPAGRGQVVALAARWGSESLKKEAGELAATFLERARDEKEFDGARLEAARNFVDLGKADPEAARQVLALVNPQASPELARGLLEAVIRSEAPETAATILDALGSMTPVVRAAAVRGLLARGEWTRALLQAIEDDKVQTIELSLDQKQALAAHPDRAIAERAKKLLARESGLPNPDREKVLAQLEPLARRAGNAERGKAVYQKQCGKCHLHGDEGKRIGPDLTGIAVHPKSEILAQVIDPNRSVEGNYRVYAVMTKEGRVVTGLLSSESRTAVEVLDADGLKHSVLREDMAEIVASPQSLMPEGFEKQMSEEEIADLLEFLARRGKYLPIALDRAATAVSTRGMFTDEEARAERLVFPDWSPKTFEGIPFHLVDPREGRTPNAILLHGPNGRLPPRMPKSVRLPCNSLAKAVHFLSGVSGWGFPFGKKGSVSMIVRLHYEDGTTEDHPLLNGEHFADYIRRQDVPGSRFAFSLRGRQIRYLAVEPRRKAAIREIELVKGEDETAPVVMAVTVETE